jgi:hypothetical protein
MEKVFSTNESAETTVKKDQVIPNHFQNFKIIKDIHIKLKI